jgi:hypothetical protein
MAVFMEKAAETVVSADVQVGEPVRVDDWFRQRTQRSGVRDAPMRTMIVVVPFVLA